MQTFTQTRRWILPLAVFGFLLPMNTASAQDEKQIGKVEIAKLKVGRFRRLANNVSETVQRGFVQYITPPKGYSFVVLWMDLKLTPGKDEDGDARTDIPSKLITFDGGTGKKIKSAGQCTEDGRLNYSSYSYGYSHYGVPEKETVPHSIALVVPDDVTKFKFTFGNVSQDIDAPSEVQDTVDRVAGATFKVAKVEVVEKLSNTIRVGDYDDPIGDAIVTNEGPANKFVVIQLYVKGKVSNNSEGGFHFPSSDLGALYGASVYAQPLGSMSDDEFEPGYNYIQSEQDVIGDFSTASVRLVFPLPGRITKFKLLYLLQPVAEIDVP